MERGKCNLRWRAAKITEGEDLLGWMGTDKDNKFLF